MVRSRVFIAMLLSVVLLGACEGEKSVQEVPRVNQQAAITVSDTSSGTVLDSASLNKIKMVFKIDSGSVFHYSVKQWSDDIQDSITLSSYSQHIYTKKGVAPRYDGAFRFDLRIDTIDILMRATRNSDKSILNESRFSSRDSADRVNPKNVIQMGPVGETVTVTMGNDAKVQEIGGVSLIFNKISSKLPQPPANEQQRTESIRFLEGAIYGNFIGMEYVVFPKHELDSSRTWTNTQSVNLGPLFSAEATTTYKIVGVKVVKGHRIATIEADLAGTITLKPAPPQMGISAKLHRASFHGKSNAVIDLENGATITKKNDISYSVTASVTENASHTTRRITQSNTTRYEVELLPH